MEFYEFLKSEETEFKIYRNGKNYNGSIFKCKYDESIDLILYKKYFNDLLDDDLETIAFYNRNTNMLYLKDYLKSPLTSFHLIGVGYIKISELQKVFVENLGKIEQDYVVQNIDKFKRLATINFKSRAVNNAYLEEAIGLYIEGVEKKYCPIISEKLDSFDKILKYINDPETYYKECIEKYLNKIDINDDYYCSRVGNSLLEIELINKYLEQVKENPGYLIDKYRDIYKFINSRMREINITVNKNGKIFTFKYSAEELKNYVRTLKNSPINIWYVSCSEKQEFEEMFKGAKSKDLISSITKITHGKKVLSFEESDKC